jgi:16S rRNA (guanine966-N2)-methyltransferase
LKITAGTLRGRKLQVPDIPGLRPTPSKVREALFNMLGNVDGFRMLDLFSGSGIMALEALSRGAASAVSIEQNRRATRSMDQLRMSLNLAESWQIITMSVEKGLSSLAAQSFDLVFADPPYEKGFANKLPILLNTHGIDCSTLVIEESARVQVEWPEGWHCRQSRRYGDTMLHFLEPDEES